jgi:predicted DCC family thiol-disulfide oxidoreductase YuxK
MMFFWQHNSVNTETTDMTVTNGGRVFYDGDCAFCVGWARRIERTLRRNGIEVVPFDMSGIGTSSSFYDEMIVEFPNGRRQGGADAVVGLARYIWWLWPLWILAKMPGTKPVLREAYRFVAARRHCISGACRTSRRTVIASWLPLMLLPPVVIALRGFFADWVFMWLLAFAVFFGCKWLTWHRADRSSASRIHIVTQLAVRDRIPRSC